MGGERRTDRERDGERERDMRGEREERVNYVNGILEKIDR